MWEYNLPAIQFAWVHRSVCTISSGQDVRFPPFRNGRFIIYGASVAFRKYVVCFKFKTIFLFCMISMSLQLRLLNLRCHSFISFDLFIEIIHIPSEKANIKSISNRYRYHQNTSMHAQRCMHMAHLIETSMDLKISIPFRRK